MNTFLVNIKKINFRNKDNGYTIFIGKVLNQKIKQRNNQMKFRGIIPSIYEDDEFEIQCNLVDDDKNGEYYEIITAIKKYSQSIKGIKSFIKKRIKGIGDKTASLIVDTLGIDTLSKIESNWKCLLTIPNLSQNKILKIKTVLQTEKKFEQLLLFVQNNNFNYKIAMTIYEDFKDESLSKIQENPYILSNIKNIGFQIADTFAKNMNLSSTNEERIKNGIIYFIKWHSKYKGDLFVFKDYLIKNFNNFLKVKGSFKDNYIITDNQIENSITELIQTKKICIEQYLNKKTNDNSQKFCLYLSEFNYIENKIVEMVKILINSSCTFHTNEFDIEKNIKEYEKETNIFLADKQKKAIRIALSNRISILTGGPGTGKTQTINAIIKCIKKINPNVSIDLTAPTGRASRRMEELTDMNASTIHRLIGLGVGNQQREEQQINSDYVIVDESSMIDAFIFFKLLQNISSNTNIIFIGDYEQLPSVGPGLILRDLIQSKMIKTTILDQIFRQAKDSLIVSNSHKIIKGINSKMGLEFNNIQKDDFYFFNENRIFPIRQKILSKIKGLISKKHIKLKDIQILSPMKVGDLGSRDLNDLIQENFNPYNNKYYELKLDNGKLFRVRDRVIQTSNNYDLNIFNGDIGYIKSISNPILDNVEILVSFSNKSVIYNKKNIDELELAYAITIHKSQGSEFPVVIMPMANIHQNMLNKHLIYTGWTRAKRMVVIVGDYNVLDKSISNNSNSIKRNSQILYKLIA